MKKKLMIGIISILMLVVPILSAVNIEKQQTLFSNTSLISSGLQPPIQWEKTYGSPSPGSSYYVQQTSDGGYIATGVVYITGGTDPEVFLVKTDSAGNQIWSQTYGGATPFDCGYCVQQTNDGGYILACIYHGYGLWLIKTDANGNLQWNKIFTSLMMDTAYSVQQTADNGYILVGGYTYAPGPPDVWVIKTDSIGNLQWDKKLGGGSTDYGHDIRQTSDGGYILVGYTNSFGSGDNDVWLIKLAADPNNIDQNIQNGIPNAFTLYQNYPNPFNPSTTIKFQIPNSKFTTLKIYNILGQEAATLVSNKLNQGNHTYTFDGTNLASGIYYYQLVAGEYRKVRKMILLR